MKSRFIEIKVSLLLGIFLMYWAGCTLFIHKHTVDGVTIVHSHPFSDSSHHHKISDLRWIDLLSHITVEELHTVCMQLEAPCTVLSDIVFFVKGNINCAAVELVRLRAPPVL